MAKIRVYRDETHGEEFPPLCVKCGGDMETTSYQKFSWVPPWVLIIILGGLLPWLIVMAILRKSMSVTLPVCERHRNHWLNRKLYIYLGLLFWICYPIALAIVWSELPKDASAVGLGIFIFGAIAWLIGGLIYTNSGIKPSQITDRFIELVGVDKEFASEWNESVKPKKKKKLREEYDVDDD